MTNQLPPRARRFLLWTARLALLAYLVQIMAIDHWPAHSTEITGIEGTSTHVEHCHGSADCSDSGGSANPAPIVETTLPLLPPSLSLVAADARTAPLSAITEIPSEPPRAT